MTKQLFLIAMFFFLRAEADIVPLRNAEALKTPQVEEVLHVSSARIFVADYDLLRKDFPALQHRSDSEIDKQLLDAVAFIAKPHVSQSSPVNTPVATDNKETKAFRPYQYKRALVFKFGDGLIDTKGTGTLDPKLGSHSNGLATLAEGLREFMWEKLAKNILQREHSIYTTVGCYGVIDLGFDVIFEDGSVHPAGLILRQAHERSERGPFGLMGNLSWEIEMTLRKYGVTTASEQSWGQKNVEYINIQGTKDGKGIVDFGSFRARAAFKNKLAEWNSQLVLLHPRDMDFVQPDTNLQVDVDFWGETLPNRKVYEYDNVYVWADDLTRQWRAGKLSREKIAETTRKNLATNHCERIFEAMQ